MPGPVPERPVIFVLAGVNGAGKSSVAGAGLRAEKLNYLGLSSAEQHIARVRARVAAGGHDIPEAKIRERWDASRRNIIALMPGLTELKVFDNSEEGDPDAGTIPPPRLLLHWRRGTIVFPGIRGLARTPDWAKPIVARALQLQRLLS